MGTDGQKDRYDEANILFSKFYDHAYKCLL